MDTCKDMRSSYLCKCPPKLFLKLKIRLQGSFFFNKHTRPPKIGFRHLLTLQVANHTWQTDLALLGFKGGEVIIVLSRHMSKEMMSNTSQSFLFLSQEIASLLKTPNPEILKNSLQYCFFGWFNQDQSIFCFVFLYRSRSMSG